MTFLLVLCVILHESVPGSVKLLGVYIGRPTYEYSWRT